MGTWEENTEQLQNTTILLLNNLNSLEGIQSSLLQVKEININDCNMYSLLNFPKNLPNLKRLRIHNSRIYSLYGLPKSMPQLLELSISSICIYNLHYFPIDLPNLEILILDHLPIRSLKGLPKKFPKLKKITITYTDIMSLRYFPHGIPNIMTINLNCNHLKSITHFPKRIPNLTELYLSYNKFSKFPFISYKFPKLKVLYLYNNSLTSFRGFPESFPVLEDLDISCNNLQSFDDFPLLVPKLKILQCEYNKLDSFSPLTSHTFLCLQELYLKDNCFRNFEGFPTVPQLKTLVIGYENKYYNNGLLESFFGLPSQMLHLRELQYGGHNIHDFSYFPIDTPLLFNITFNYINSLYGIIHNQHIFSYCIQHIYDYVPNSIIDYLHVHYPDQMRHFIRYDEIIIPLLTNLYSKSLFELCVQEDLSELEILRIVSEGNHTTRIILEEQHHITKSKQECIQQLMQKLGEISLQNSDLKIIL